MQQISVPRFAPHFGGIAPAQVAKGNFITGVWLNIPRLEKFFLCKVLCRSREP